MTQFIWTKEESGLDHNEIIDTPLSEEQLDLIDKIRSFEQNPLITQRIGDSSFVREYLLSFRCIYGRTLGRPIEHILNSLNKSRDYLKDNLEATARYQSYYGDNTEIPGYLAPVEEMCGLYTTLIELIKFSS